MDDTTLSAISLFWAMFAVALNTMSQPTGKTLGFPSRFNFFLRCSPLVCGAHGLYTLIPLCFYGLQKSRRTPNDGIIAAILAERFDCSEEQRQASTGRKVLLGVFATGALLQAIKLYAVSGVDVSKAFCGLYLTAFVLDEVFMMVARRTESTALPTQHDVSGVHSQAPTSSTGSTWKVIDILNTAALFESALLAEDVLTHSLETSIRINSNPAVLVLPLALLGIAFQSMMAFCFLQFVLDYHFRPTVANDANTTSVLITNDWEVFVYWIINFTALQSLARIPFLNVLPLPAMLLLAAAPAALLRRDWFRKRHIGEKQRERYHGFFVVGFAALHLVAAVMWYREVYQPKYTSKPGWTNYLG